MVYCIVVIVTPVYVSKHLPVYNCHVSLSLWYIRPLPRRLARALNLVPPFGGVVGGALPPKAPHALEPAANLEQLGRAEHGVEDVEGVDGDDDEDALEADEEALLANDGAGPALAQLRDAEGAAPEDAEGGEGEGAEEEAEAQRLAHADEARVVVRCVAIELVLVLVLATVGAQRKVDGRGDEAQERKDLEAQACDHDVGAGGGGAAAVEGDGGHAAAGGLEDERDDVAGDELCAQDISYVPSLYKGEKHTMRV